MIYGPDLAHVHDSAFDGFVRSAAPHLLRRLRAAGIERGLVVDLGCGGGILAAELLAAGYDVLGVDLSEDALAIARERAPGARLVQGSIADVELPLCAAVTAIGEVVNYDAPATLAPLFARVRSALRLDGLFAFDAAGPGREPDGRREFTLDGDGWRLAVEVAEDRFARRLTRWISVERDGWVSEETHTLRLFPAHEVVAELSGAGFLPRVLRGGYGGDNELPPGVNAFVASAG